MFDWTIKDLPAKQNGEKRVELRLIWGKGRERKFQTLRFSSRKEARQHVDQVHFENREAEPKTSALKPVAAETIEPESTFLAELEYYMENRFPTFRPGWRTNIRGYEKELSPYFERHVDSGQQYWLKVSEVTKQLLDQIARDLRTKDNSVDTINKKLGWIQSVLNFSLERDRISMNPIATYKKTKAPKPEMKFWESGMFQGFLQIFC